MSVSQLWNNADGLLVRFNGEQGKRGNKLGLVKTEGVRREYRQTFHLTGAARTIYSADLNNDGTLDGFTGLDSVIPAGCIITEARAVVTTPGAGGTSVAVNVYAADGTILLANGLVTATQGALANLTANANIVGSGATLNTRLAANGYVSAVTVGTFTAGVVDVYYTVIDAR